MNGFSVVGPRTLSEVLAYAEEAGNNSVFLAGGTDWIIKRRRESMAGGVIIDLSQVDELNYIQDTEGYLAIGSAVTFSQLASSELVWARARCLAKAAEQLGSAQIRNRATIGGNVANAAPAADGGPPLLALNAEALLLKGKAQKWLAMDDVMPNLRRGDLAGWLFAGFRIPVVPGALSGFVKLGSRRTVSIAKLNIAARICVDDQKYICGARLAMGAVAKTAVRLPVAEKALIGLKYYESAEDLANGLVSELDDLIAGRSSLSYKRQAIRGLAFDLIQDLIVALEGIRVHE